MSQLILVKKDFPETNIVILGGKEAPYVRIPLPIRAICCRADLPANITQVAKELAAADISVILSEDRPAPDTFRDKDAVVGPPLTPSVASYLSDAGVTFAIALYAYRTLPQTDYSPRCLC